MFQRNLRTNLIAGTLLVTFLLFGLSGCGGRDDPTPVPEPPTATAAPTEVPAPVGDAAAGETVYKTTCVACHGADAKGVANLGKSLHPGDSDFISGQTDAELVEYIKVGRTPDDPLNTTGVGMPAKGGNPALSEQGMYDVVAFMRTLK